MSVIHAIPQGFSIIIILNLYVKAFTQSEKLKRWIILKVDCVTILHSYKAKWLHDSTIKIINHFSFSDCVTTVPLTKQLLFISQVTTI